MGLLKMIRIREIAGRPIARQMFLQNFIEDLPIGGDESLQQSLIGVRVMHKIAPHIVQNLNQSSEVTFIRLYARICSCYVCRFQNMLEHA